MSDAAAARPLRSTHKRQSSRCRRRHRLFSRSLPVSHSDAARRADGSKPRCAAILGATHRALRPETYVRNVLETIDFDGAKFDSLGVNYLLHCLPGDMATKARAFDCLSPLMIARRRRLRLDAAAGRRRAQLRGAEADGVLQFQGRILEYAGRFGDADARTRKALQRRQRRNGRLRRAVFGDGERFRRLAPTPSAPAPNSRRDRGAARFARLHRHRR